MPRKTIIITGATSGIGEETAVELARNGDDIYLLVRNTAKAEKFKRYILVHARNTNVYIIPCDLSNLASVKKAADQLKATVDKVNILVNNAGGIFQERQLSTDGFEMTFAVNHLGHFLLTLSLLPLLQKGKARVVNLSSAAHKAAKPDMNDLQSERKYSGVKVYANAKLYNIYFTQALAQKYGGDGVTAYAVHPGIVNTNFGKAYQGMFKFVLDFMRRFMIQPKEAADTPIYLATHPGIENLSGQYFQNREVAKTASIANNAHNRDELWNKSLQLVKPFLV